MIAIATNTDGLTTLTWPAELALTWASLDALTQALQSSLADSATRAILICYATDANNSVNTSAPPSASTSYDGLLDPTGSASAIAQRLLHWHPISRRLELSDKPVAFISLGSLQGFALELALCCRQRWLVSAAASAAEGVHLSVLPDGLIPAFGGTQRLGRLLGVQRAATFLLNGERLPADQALNLGLIHGHVADLASAQSAAQTWLNAPERAGERQTWDQARFRPPGAAVASAAGLQYFTQANARLRRRDQVDTLASRHLLSCLYEGLQVDLDTGLRTEARYAAAVLSAPETLNRLRHRRTLAALPTQVAQTLPTDDPWAKLLQPAPLPPEPLKALAQAALGAYIAAGLDGVLHGLPPAMIERCARLAGMPQGPLAMADQLPINELLDLLARDLDPPSDAAAAIPPSTPQARAALCQQVRAARLDHNGLGPGFYEDLNIDARQLWPGLSQHLPIDTTIVAQASTADLSAAIQARLLSAQAQAAERFLAQSALNPPLSRDQADLAAVMSWGAPIHLGGPLRWSKG